MMKKISKTDSTGGKQSPTIWVSPERYLFPYKIQLFGANWGPCPVTFWLEGKVRLQPVRFLVGEGQRDSVKPVAGQFVILLTIPDLEAGRHEITAMTEWRSKKMEASAGFVLKDVPETEKDGRPTHRSFRRQAHFLRERFPDGINRLPGSRLRALKHRDLVRRLGVVGRLGLGPLTNLKDFDRPSPPVDPGCNWYCIGPSVVRKGQVFSTSPDTYTTAPISGRITSIAYDPNDTNVVYAAAAQGGIWKSTDGGLNWQPKSDFEVSLAMGCVTVDPSVTDASGRSRHIVAGTGEPNGSDSYYGGGILFSNDGGDTWVARGTAMFARDAFSTIVVDPADNQHFYAATDAGVYESTDEGVNWNLIESGICYDLVVDWSNPGGAELYVGQSDVGVRCSQDGGATWTTLGGGLPVAMGRIALAMSPSDANTLYAAFADDLGGLTGIYCTSDGGTTWTKTTDTPTNVHQSSYNLVLAVDPTDNKTVLFGEVHLWRTADAGANWIRVSTGSPGIHPDQHAITFHPINGNLVFVGNDGGVFYSTDGGRTYTHRNKDLATLQYYGIFNHTQWDAVILGGTQDNGAQRYLGHPAWEHSALGDAAFAAINSTTDTRRWYETRYYSFPCFRSDTAGSPGSWVKKQSGISTNRYWFYPPLEMDPNDSSVLYVGYDELWRTSDHADTWAAITGSLVDARTNITAIAVAPSDSNTIYVGMQDGRVFKVTFSGGTWAATDVTGAPLPAGQVSDIAVHPTNSNTVYVTTSNLIYSEAAGEFTNDHVFKTTDGGTSWTNISTGLTQANPVNTIVIDPANPNTVFIGCDIGIFRSDNSGAAWYAWDNGLPNCSVQDLKFFAPNRLLRAATHGRSVWERPVDAATCPLVDVYLRDNCVDTGLSFPSPDGIQHPFTAGETVYWYQSVDIKVDSPDPTTNTYQTPSTDIDYIQFEELDHNNPRRETWVRVFVQIHTRGNKPATNVRVRAFWANAGGGLPHLPNDFWTAFPNADPADTSVWHPVGPVRTISTLYPGQPQIGSWSWLVPADAPDHTCMLCVVKSDEDDVTTTSLAIGNAVRNDNNVTLKNLNVENVNLGATGADETMSGPYFIDFATYYKRRPFDIRFNPGVLPNGTRVWVFFPDFTTEQVLEKALHGMKVTKRKGFKLPPRPDEICGKPTRFNLEKAFVLDVDRAGKGERPGLYGIIPKPNREKFSAAFFVELPNKKMKMGDRYSFHIEHWVDNDHVGGCSYEFKVYEKIKSKV
jgi:photosystem II stability/assembly factor-like uncharacterized protein